MDILRHENAPICNLDHELFEAHNLMRTKGQRIKIADSCDCQEMLFSLARAISMHQLVLKKTCEIIIRQLTDIWFIPKRNLCSFGCFIQGLGTMI